MTIRQDPYIVNTHADNPTAVGLRLMGLRNRFPASCLDCGRRAGVDGGFLYPKEPGGRWSVRCDDCHRAAEGRARRGREEAEAEARRRREEAEAEARRRREEARLRREAEERRRAEEERLRREAEERRRIEDDPMIRELIARLKAEACLRKLGLTAPVTADQIKSAYRRLALVAHPDQGGDARAFVALNAAYREALARFGGAAAGVRP